MAAREYTSFSDGNVDQALRLVEQREGEGWELVTILPCAVPMIFGLRSEFGVTVVMRRPAAQPASA